MKNLKNITVGALFSALICIGAFIKIPLPQLPITMQMFFVLLAGLILTPNTALLAVGGYVLLGLAGLPVFSSGGGISYVLMPSFGYIIGFFAAAPLMAVICRRQKGFIRMIFASLAGIAVIYIVGISYFCLITYFILHADISAEYIIKLCILAMLPGDLISSALAILSAAKLRKTNIM